MEERIAALEREINRLKREFQEHRHTGLDSKPIDLTDQIESQGSVTTPDNSAVDGTYGASEAAVIANTRTRVNQIEDALQSFGILS